MAGQARSEWRHVEVRDPNLGDQANAEVSAQLRDAVGADDVLVAAGTPDHRRAAHRTRSPLWSPLAALRLDLLVTGLVVAVAIGVWGIAAQGVWALVALLVIVAAGAIVITAAVVHMAAESEHLSPETVAELESEGDVDPDRAFNAVVDELTVRRP
jgi:hypothetical protein